jgi:hypothetical protein
MVVDTFINSLYCYIFGMQGKVDIFVNLFGNLLRARGSILLQLSPSSLGCIPSSLSEEMPEQTTETKHVKEIVDAVKGLGAFGLFFFSLFLENIGEKERICYCMAVFVDDLLICFLYVLSCLCLLSFIFFL